MTSSPASQRSSHSSSAASTAAAMAVAPASDPSRRTDVALGTGSAVATKYRNVSGLLVRVPGRGALLLDCGDGTWGQLVRLYGPDGARDVLRDLRGVHISHQHGDHLIGLATLLAVRKQVSPL